MPWNESWTEGRRMLCALGAFRAQSRAFCAGRALGAPQQASFNPLVLGSSPRRPTLCMQYELINLAMYCHNRPVDRGSSRSTA